MELSDISIRPATKADASYIADAIMTAVGDDITLGFAGSVKRIPLVKQLFKTLAECDDSQYSYLNTLIAEDDNRSVAGVIIGYDGADLHRLRQRFIDKANQILGYSFSQENMNDEASPDEIYIDTLCVFPEFQRKGVATKLIESAIERYNSLKKPVGLIVDEENKNARRLYERLGFRKIGMTAFAVTMMEHMQRI